jgi:AraC-like DNA-binding protein
MPHSEHLISYHIVTEGRCYAGLDHADEVELVAGDVIVFPHGDRHVLASESGLRMDGDEFSASPPRFPFGLAMGDSGPVITRFVCGFLGCDLRPFNPPLAALPRLMHMRGMSNPWLGAFVRQVIEETRPGRPGADTVLTRMAELMFIELLRRYLDELPPGQTGWLAGLRDEVVGKVLTLLHARPEHPWTINDIAREVASSRSSVAKRFTELVGQPPMQYLTQLRMQVAANQLAQTTAKIAAVGAAAGYDSEAAFSRAFKKATGLSPGAWREARRSAVV